MTCYDCRLTRQCRKPEKHISLCIEFAPVCCGALMECEARLKTRTRFRCKTCKSRFSLPLPVRLMEVATRLVRLAAK